MYIIYNINYTYIYIYIYIYSRRYERLQPPIRATIVADTSDYLVAVNSDCSRSCELTLRRTFCIMTMYIAIDFFSRVLHSSATGPQNLCSNSFPSPQMEGALCADFTLDGPKAQREREQYQASSRRRRCCRYTVVLLALVVFVGIMVVISWYLTGGKTGLRLNVKDTID